MVAFSRGLTNMLLIFDEEISLESGDVMTIDYDYVEDRYIVKINNVKIRTKEVHDEAFKQ